ncbi:MAG: MBL fold metallo-hydrolase [Solirubrobacteraceae bacterium]
MDLSLFFAGTAGSVPSARRGLPAVLIRRGGDRLLFDCGEGTQRQLLRSVGLLDLDSVFITHFHADHWLGLPGMLKSFALRERTEPLTVYGPVGLKALMAEMRVIFGRLPYKCDIVELEPADTVQRGGYLIAAIPVRHKVQSAFGYALVEEARPGHLDPQLAEQLGVTPGPDFGRLQRGETVNGRTFSSTRPRSCTRRPSAPARPNTAQPAKPLSSRSKPTSGCSRSPTSPAATPAASCATRPARSFPPLRLSATSTPSTCRSPSVAPPRSSAGPSASPASALRRGQRTPPPPARDPSRRRARQPRPPSPSHPPDTFPLLL